MKPVVKFFVSMILLILIGRLFQLQVLQNDYYNVLSEKDRLRREIIPAPRGRILSREGDILAESQPSYSLVIDPYQVDTSEIIKLSKILDINKNVIFNKVKPYFRTSIIRRIPFDIVSKIVESQEEFHSVRFITEPVRHYPMDSILSHLLGYTGEITNEELETFKGIYRKGDIVGKKGVELEYEEYLKGKKGVSFVEVDVMGRVVKRFNGDRARDPVRGYDIKLTISSALTYLADSLFSKFKCGACIAMNPNNGEILLYYSKPGYPSNKMTSGIPLCDWDSLRNRKDAPLWDRIICGEYPPGSIFKITTTLIALKEGVLNENKTFIPCEESLYIGDRYFGCWKKHEELKLKNAIVQSCDIFFYQVGMSMTLEKITHGSKGLGFGKRCDIDLPGERKGFLPSREWYNKKYTSRGWDKGVKANLAIGQGEILTTPLQMVTFFSTIAGDGITYKPHILKNVMDRNGKIIKESISGRVELPVSREYIDIVKKAMKSVVNEKKGTAYLSRLSKIEVAGKTGTAQNPQGEDHSLFVGFAPYDNPEIVVFTIVENTGHGSVHAAPITTKIIKRYLKNNNI